MTLITSPVPAESGHWYARTGEPAYTLIGANGKERNTTLRDARNLDLVPSVTAITRLAAAPGLVNWQIGEAIMAALTLPRHENELDSEFIARVRDDSKERAKKAAERGTDLHTDIERAIQGLPHSRHQKHVKALSEAMQERWICLFEGEAEKTFAHPDGFGGKVDYHCGDVVVDFKSKQTIEDGKKLVYDEHIIQLAAYGYGLGIERPRCFSAFVGIDDAQVVLHEWTDEERQRGLGMFKCLLTLWRIKNGL